jgi:hypothetical protein
MYHSPLSVPFACECHIAELSASFIMLSMPMRLIKIKVDVMSIHNLQTVALSANGLTDFNYNLY